MHLLSHCVRWSDFVIELKMRDEGEEDFIHKFRSFSFFTKPVNQFSRDNLNADCCKIIFMGGGMQVKRF